MTLVITPSNPGNPRQKRMKHARSVPSGQVVDLKCLEPKAGKGRKEANDERPWGRLFHPAFEIIPDLIRERRHHMFDTIIDRKAVGAFLSDLLVQK